MISVSTTRNIVMLLIGMLLSNSSYATFTQVISFGDSLSDAGNVFQATGTSPPPPYFDGRFSDGPVWNEILATSLGLTTPTPSLLGGTNYAWGGANTTSAGTVPSTADQVSDFIITTDGSADPDALYTISTGSNDIFGVGRGVLTKDDLTAAATSVASLVNDLKAAGAESILVLNAPNLGLVPATVDNPSSGTALSNMFNTTLLATLADISGVALIDIFTGTTNIVAEPTLFGLDNVTDPCITTSFPDCSKHLFWDGTHPTTAGHALIAEAALLQANSLKSVPLPTALPLIISALVGMKLLRRKRV